MQNVIVNGQILGGAADKDSVFNLLSSAIEDEFLDRYGMNTRLWGFLDIYIRPSTVNGEVVSCYCGSIGLRWNEVYEDFKKFDAVEFWNNIEREMGTYLECSAVGNTDVTVYYTEEVIEDYLFLSRSLNLGFEVSDFIDRSSDIYCDCKEEYLDTIEELIDQYNITDIDGREYWYWERFSLIGSAKHKPKNEEILECVRKMVMEEVAGMEISGYIYSPAEDRYIAA